MRLRFIAVSTKLCPETLETETLETETLETETLSRDSGNPRHYDITGHGIWTLLNWKLVMVMDCSAHRHMPMIDERESICLSLATDERERVVTMQVRFDGRILAMT